MMYSTLYRRSFWLLPALCSGSKIARNFQILKVQVAQVTALCIYILFLRQSPFYVKDFNMFAPIEASCIDL